MSKQANLSRKVAVNSPERKPSVFERLGSKSCVVSGKNVCRSWAQNGTCPLNKSCKLAHTHIMFSPLKRSKSETMKKSVIAHKKSKDEHKKLIRSHQNSECEWEGWELGDLEDADEKVLEKRKQELQRELQLQLKKEKELTRRKDKRTEKKRAASTSSSSSTTSESSSSSTSSSTSSSEPRKRQNRKRKHASSSSDSEVSPHRRKKSPKSVKGKVTTFKKSSERRDSRVTSEAKSKNTIVPKKTVVQKKSYSPSWEKSRGRSPVKQQPSKKSSPHHSPESKNKSSSPRYDKTAIKNKSRVLSPKQKAKESSPKRPVRKVKESSGHTKEKSRQSPLKPRTTPTRIHKVSPSRSRRHEESSDKRRGHYEERKHSPRRDRKRDTRRGRSNDDDNGGLKKGGKILPLKPSSYNKDSGIKKETIHVKSSEKNSDVKSKEEDNEKDRIRMDRERDRNEKEKSKCEKDRSKHKKGGDEHDRRPARDRESDRSSTRGRDDRCRDREADRLRYVKEREAERQKERDEALERCRERQRERERLEKEKKEKEEKKHRDATDRKSKELERELPSLLDIKAENPIRSHGDSGNSKSSDKHLPRDSRRNIDKGSDKTMSQDKDARDRGSPEKDRDRRDSRRPDDERRVSDKDYDGRRNRESARNSSEVRRNMGDGRRVVDDVEDSRRPWDDVRAIIDPVLARRSLDPGINDRRPHSLARRSGDDHYRRRRGEGDMDVRDFPLDDRRGRKLMHPDWDPKDQSLDFRDSDVRDDWNHSERHHDWNTRYDHKWRDHEDSSRDGVWNHFSRRPPRDEWSEWPQEPSRPLYPEERIELINEEFPDHNGKRHNEVESIPPLETNKNKEVSNQEEIAAAKKEKDQKEGDALSDISDDPDDILNQDDELPEDNPPVKNTQQNSSQQIYVRSNEFLFDQRRPLLECLGERSLDFEEISDEELEEEARVCKGIIDVLGADWAGLVQQTRPKTKRFEVSGSARRRWMTDRIISRIGISLSFAKQPFVDKLVEKYKGAEIKGFKHETSTPMEISENDVISKPEQEQKKESKELKSLEEIKSEENVNCNGLITTELMEGVEYDKPEVGVNLLHPVPALHTAMNEAQNFKLSLFQSHNRFKRALSARTDLNLRRELCSLPSKEALHFTLPLDNKMYETSIQLFYENLPTAVV